MSDDKKLHLSGVILALERDVLKAQLAKALEENAALVEALEYVRDWARSTSPVLLSEVAERALKGQEMKDE